MSIFNGSNSFLKLVELEGKGRCLVAKVDISPGETVLKDTPLAYHLGYENWATHCSACLSASGQLAKCVKCKKVAYCNRDCQKKGWKMHKRECDWISQSSPARADTIDADILLSRIIRAREKDNTALDRLFHGVEHMDSQLKQDVVEQTSRVAQLAGCEVDHKQFLQTFGAYTCNAFNVWNQTMKVLGRGLYPEVAMMNHSCRPHCWTFFDGPNLQIRALRRIRAGEEVTISYIDLVESRENRIADLKSSYYFECNCERCTDDSSESIDMLMKKKRCSSEKCMDQKSYLFLDEKCSSCGTVCVLDPVSDTLIEETIEAADDMEGFESALRTAKKEYHPFHRLYISLIRNYIQVCVSSREWETLVEVADMHSKALVAVLGEVHPALALHYFLVGKAHIELKQYEEALRLLQDALSIAIVTHGVMSEFVSSIHTMLELLKSLNAKRSVLQGG